MFNQPRTYKTCTYTYINHICTYKTYTYMLYFLSTDPRVCAKWHMDIHIAGMAGVYNQLISNTFNRYKDQLPDQLKSPQGEIFDKDTVLQIMGQEQQEDHPISVWAANSAGNFMYILLLAIEVHRENSQRFGKVQHGAHIPDLAIKCMQSLPLYGDGNGSVQATPLPVINNQYISLEFKKKFSQKYKDDRYVFLGDPYQACRYHQDKYKRLALKEKKRTKKRIPELFTNRKPPKFLSSLEPIIIS